MLVDGLLYLQISSSYRKMSLMSLVSEMTATFIPLLAKDINLCFKQSKPGAVCTKLCNVFLLSGHSHHYS